MVLCNALDITALVLAVWRLSYMLIEEDGLFNIFDLIRRGSNRIGVGDLFACIYCMSVWVGAGLLFITRYEAGVFFIRVLALSAAAVFISRIEQYFKRRMAFSRED